MTSKIKAGLQPELQDALIDRTRLFDTSRDHEAGSRSLSAL